MILAADIGGTKCNFILFKSSEAGLETVLRTSIPTASVPSFAEAIDAVRAEVVRHGHSLKDVKAAGFGSAGTCLDDRMLSRNLPWPVEKRAAGEALSLPLKKIVLLNDLAAGAASIAHLKKEDLLALNDAPGQQGAPMALIAAGTGLGEAVLFPDGGRYRVFPSEAGMSDFAPCDDREFQLLQGLRQRVPRVCTEDIVSGRGFEVIHRILFPEVHHSFLEDDGRNAAAGIAQQAMAGSCTACADTMQIWIGAYGGEAGNMALRVLPFGGFYIGGGIALKILPKLKEGGFVRAFADRVKLGSELMKIPIYVILNEDAPVIGAAYEALAVAGS